LHEACKAGRVGRLERLILDMAISGVWISEEFEILEMLSGLPALKKIDTTHLVERVAGVVLNELICGEGVGQTAGQQQEGRF
jgi:hypothetical protein